jgi:uncharacterized protein YuzE
MRVHYDEEVDAFRLLRDDARIVESEEVQPGVVVDFNASNEVVGIEVLDFKRRAGVWHDREADYLEVIFDQRDGYFRETANDQVMEKVDSKGRVLGFSILKVSTLTKMPLRT